MEQRVQFVVFQLDFLVRIAAFGYRQEDEIDRLVQREGHRIARRHARLCSGSLHPACQGDPPSIGSGRYLRLQPVQLQTVEAFRQTCALAVTGLQRKLMGARTQIADLYAMREFGADRFRATGRSCMIGRIPAHQLVSPLRIAAVAS